MAGIRVPYAMAKSDQIPMKNVWTKLNKRFYSSKRWITIISISWYHDVTGALIC